MKWAKRSTSARDKTKIPAGLVPPMYPTLVDKVPLGPIRLHEIKWDEYRIGVYLTDGKVRVLTRNLHDWTEKFPSIVEAVSQLEAKHAMIDGEAFVADVQGMSHSNLLQRALGKAGNRHSIMLAVFDLALLDGEDLRNRPLAERRELLHDYWAVLIPEGIVFSDGIEGDPGDLLQKACAWISGRCIEAARQPLPFRTTRGMGEDEMYQQRRVHRHRL